MVEKTLTLMDALLSCMEISESIDDAHHELERCVLFSLTWGVAGLLENRRSPEVGCLVKRNGLRADEHAATRCTR